MATEDVRVTSPVEIKDDSKSRVALDLMEYISRREDGKDAEKKTRDYWLTLYSQCYKTANGEALKYVLERA
jgi:hypothetical protein